ncbi:hypothetical protein PoB_000949200 [Plakobranchus ocellatus]|uniref:Uncharacterized protein n=1 Tax=Plakobranchus ocellatus TaxID=259542 RepID=A0AAV3YLG7_9GAST|nr:hypothetical protein PoB_000949200 [Plakobranchus ocellatus]
MSLLSFAGLLAICGQVYMGMYASHLCWQCVVKFLWDEDILQGPEVERDAGLQTFDAWRKEQGTYDTLKQDVAVLWTGFELVRGGNPATAVTAGDGTRGLPWLLQQVELLGRVGRQHDENDRSSWVTFFEPKAASSKHNAL